MQRVGRTEMNLLIRCRVVWLMTALGLMSAPTGMAIADGVSKDGAPPYPFIGKWDCEVAVMSFTETTYNNGSEDLPIIKIQEGTDGSYALFIEDDYFISLSGFTGESMGWLSSATGDNFNCVRID